MIGRISYMGTKHELAPMVRDVLKKCQPGRVLDAFAGMGAVAESLANERPVWTNDVQHFAFLATSCRIADENEPLSAKALAKAARPYFRTNLGILREQNAPAIALERSAMRADTFTGFRKALMEAEARGLVTINAFGCFTKTYSYGYFALHQCMHIDSIRFALEMLKGTGSITESQFRWGLLALGSACLRIANTTGHFAQYLTPSASNYRRIIKQFRRNLWEEWLDSVSRVKPVGAPEWRRGNLATRSDSTSLLLSPEFEGSAKVVYCDPPYTNDQYSRYYHIWETLVLYDYPETFGKGRYRGGRFVTDFSLASKVVASFRRLIEDISESGSDLVLSYPTNGLLHEVGGCPLELLRSAYPSASVEAELDHRHSTMGASKGPAKASVKERIYLARV